MAKLKDLYPREFALDQRLRREFERDEADRDLRWFMPKALRFFADEMEAGRLTPDEFLNDMILDLGRELGLVPPEPESDTESSEA